MGNRLAATLDTLVGRVERSDVLDPVAERLAAAGSALKVGRIRDLLSGTPIGHPAHPALVAVPIGAWTTTSVLDMCRQPRAARLTAGLGVLTAVPAALTGFSDWLYTSGAERRVGLAHAFVNDAAIALYSASWLARRRDNQLRGAALAAAGAVVVSVGGWIGGHLAYAQGVGVDTTAFQKAPSEWTDVLDAAALPGPGAMRRVSADGVPVVLIATAEGLRAMADRCTHRGGSLSEGEISGECVVCPWHGSAFDLTDGTVAHGPASRPQPTYEVRVEGGRVQVRRPDEPRTLRTNPSGV